MMSAKLTLFHSLYQIHSSWRHCPAHLHLQFTLCTLLVSSFYSFFYSLLLFILQFTRLYLSVSTLNKLLEHTVCSKKGVFGAIHCCLWRNWLRPCAPIATGPRGDARETNITAYAVPIDFWLSAEGEVTVIQNNRWEISWISAISNLEAANSDCCCFLSADHPQANCWITVNNTSHLTPLQPDGSRQGLRQAASVASNQCDYHTVV